MSVSHSLKTSGSYEFNVNGVKIENAVAEKNSASFHLCYNGTEADFKTMKALKESLWMVLPEAIKNPPPKPKQLTIKDWMRSCAVSHTGQYVFIKEAKKIWPHLKGSELVGYLIRKHMENCAALYKGANGDFARNWIVLNPEVGQYDHDEEDRRLAKLYPEAA